MLKRATAFLFVLLIAGQVWAGVCGCLEDGDHERSSCCMRDRSDAASMNKIPCCESDCGDLDTQATPRTNTENSMKLTLRDNPEAYTLTAVFKFVPFRARGNDLERPKGFVRPHLPRPPELYLRNHAFLI